MPTAKTRLRIEVLGKTIEVETTENGCWNCTNVYIGTNGYPMIHYEQKSHNAHRVIYAVEKNKGILPKRSIVIRHICHNKLCINPDHLISGSGSDNKMDDIKIGIGNVKLSVSQIKSIRLYYQLKLKNQYELAEMFGVNQSCIYQIVNRITWKHIP